MVQKLNKNIDRNINKVIKAEALHENNSKTQTIGNAATGTQPARPDPQVSSTKQTSPRRTFTAHEKRTILEAYEACESIEERGKLLRKTGLYHARISYWRKLRDAGRLGKGNSGKAKKAVVQLAANKLAQENARLKKKLSQAEAIIDLQKKVCELLGEHILPHETSEVK